MPGDLAERAVMAALHQGDPPGWIVANRGDLLLSPGRGGNPRCHAKMIASFVCWSSVWHPGTQSGPGGRREGPFLSDRGGTGHIPELRPQGSATRAQG